jgi:hypothetical protein
MEMESLIKKIRTKIIMGSPMLANRELNKDTPNEQRQHLQPP